MSQKYNSEYINELEAFFIGRNDNINRYGNAISHYLMLPGLIGFWPMATVQRSTGNVPNYAPTYTGATKQDLVYNGNPTFNYTTTGVPYVDLDGTGDYLGVADNTDLDILGTESWAAVPGLTMGCWARFTNAAAAQEVVMAKGSGAAANTGYWMNRQATGEGRFIISDGAAFQGPTGATIAAGAWTFMVGRYVPSASVDLYINQNTKVSDLVGVPANLVNSITLFTIGAYDSGGGVPAGLTTGDITLAFLSANALSDAIIQSLFQQTRSLFGV